MSASWLWFLVAASGASTQLPWDYVKIRYGQTLANWTGTCLAQTPGLVGDCIVVGNGGLLVELLEGILEHGVLLLDVFHGVDGLVQLSSQQVLGSLYLVRIGI